MADEPDQAATIHAAPPLDRGDRLPVVPLPDQDGRPVNLLSDDLAGRSAILAFETGDAEEGLAALLAALAEGLNRIDAGDSLLLAVSRRSVAECRRLQRVRTLPCPVLSDVAGTFCAKCGLDDRFTKAPAAVLIVDANLRLVCKLVGDGGPQLAERAVRELAAAAAADEQRPLGLHPPVLVLPRVLGEDDCGWLVEVWHRPVRVLETDGFTSAGHDLEGEDFKVRGAPPASMVQMVVRDPAVQRHLDERLYRRVVPEIRKAFQTGVSQREDYRIAAYDASAQGNLPAHRDNPTRQTRHRRFTISVSLNGGKYEGGGLRFPEYDRRSYLVPTGTAIVWSCALLHEVLPVVSGRRFILGTHLFGT